MTDRSLVSRLRDAAQAAMYGHIDPRELLGEAADALEAAPDLVDIGRAEREIMAACGELRVVKMALSDSHRNEHLRLAEEHLGEAMEALDPTDESEAAP